MDLAERKFSIVFGVAAFMFLYVTAMLWQNSRSSALNPIDSARVAEKRRTVEQCRDMRFCVGGFIKFKASKFIYRIDTCRDNCQPYVSYGVSHLVDVLGSKDERFFDRIEYIVLPRGEPMPGATSRWEEAAITYARQFVMQ